MRIARPTLAIVLLLLVCNFSLAQQPPTTQPSQVFANLITRTLALIEPPDNTPPRTFSTRLVITKADGLPNDLLNATLDLAYQAPDHLRLTATYRNQTYALCRNAQQLWTYLPQKGFGLIGDRNLPRFAGDPTDIDRTVLPPFRLPLSLKAQVVALPLLSQVELLANDTLSLTPPKAVAQLINLPSAKLELVMPDPGAFPTRIRFTDGKRINIEIELQDTKLTNPWPADKWKLQRKPNDKIEQVALSHLTKFVDVAQSTLRNNIPTLGPATGQRAFIASTDQGRLEIWDGTRVLFLKGTPEAMGRQHGTLLKRQVRDVADRMLYGVGVASSFAKGSWFFIDIEGAYKRLEPHMSQRYFAEIDAIATAADISKYEMRLANFFPELFHCSGFSIFGEATVNGTMYHGRILDYLKGVGLEQNATVMVFQPEQGNAWVNIGYAGFVGSVSAMNEKHISIGEMGGRGEGNWDGKPMAQLVRDVMEKASTLEEAVEIFRKAPRTCEYYYVISDGNTKKAVALECTPTKFVTVSPGESHPQLQHPMKDTVLISAGSRYETLAQRVKDNYGKLDAEGARNLMLRPVAMTSNIHSILFAPETLDFWVANADSKNPAAHTRYTHYNLAEMLKAPAAPKP
ncbi:MAG: C45 family autoproteolytic acyltransferase/hydrolase [Planctomycetota bacterium]|nr:C45 family autoproteolytic acyltransferase/hydrolase [Planctomycetota bacterium]